MINKQTQPQKRLSLVCYSMMRTNTNTQVAEFVWQSSTKEKIIKIGIYLNVSQSTDEYIIIGFGVSMNFEAFHC